MMRTRDGFAPIAIALMLLISWAPGCDGDDSQDVTQQMTGATLGGVPVHLSTSPPVGYPGDRITVTIRLGVEETANENRNIELAYYLSDGLTASAYFKSPEGGDAPSSAWMQGGSAEVVLVITGKDANGRDLEKPCLIQIEAEGDPGGASYTAAVTTVELRPAAAASPVGLTSSSSGSGDTTVTVTWTGGLGGEYVHLEYDPAVTNATDLPATIWLSPTQDHEDLLLEFEESPTSGDLVKARCMGYPVALSATSGPGSGGDATGEE